MNKTLIVIVLIFGILHGTCLGQNSFIRFKQLTRDNGLSSNRVNDIIEDSQGFIWFGTEDGLNKYNGYTFEVFRNNPTLTNSIPDNSIDVILEDVYKPNLWLGTRKGLVYFDQIHQQFNTIVNSELKDSLTGNINITSLCFDSDTNLFIGTFTGLFFLPKTDFSNEFPVQPSIRKLSNERVYSVFCDSNNDIWIGCHKGFFRYNPSAQNLEPYFTDSDMQAVQFIQQDSEKHYWIGTDNAGLFYIEDHPDKGISRIFNKETKHFVVNRVHGMIEDSPGNYYFLIRDGGLYHYNMDADQMIYYAQDIFDKNSINSSALISGIKSSNGIIWLGTYNSGVNYIDNASKRFYHFKVSFKENGLFCNNIRVLIEDWEHNIWIGTKEGGGLTRYNPETNKYTNYKKSSLPKGLKDDYVFALCELNRQELLVGTFRNGLALFNKITGEFTYHTHQKGNPESLSDNRIYAIFKDAQNQVWIGNYNELQLFNSKTNAFTTIQGIERPRCFCNDGTDRIWIGTKEHGLYIYNKISGKYLTYLHNPDDEKSISSNDIYALEKDEDGFLWIATKNGINRFNHFNNQFERYTELDGLPANWICGLLIENKNSIWVSTSNGISNFEVQKKLFHNYDIRDGLQGNEFEGYVALKTHDNKMLFGGRNGFNLFSPSEIVYNTTEPKIIITGFKLFNKELEIGADSPLQKHISFTKTITLKHNQSAITIDYVALNFTSPEKNHYAYKLEGFDQDWIQAGANKSAIYTNIPPGNYIFRVIGSNNDNIWNNKGASLQITILNPYWKTIWAYLIYALILGLLIYLSRQLILYRFKQQNLLNLERIDKQRIQEVNQLKLRFFTNISHEFRTPLTLISGPLSKLMSYNNDNDEQKFLLSIMQKNVKRLLELVNELMDFRRAEQGLLKIKVAKKDLLGFMQQIIDCFEETAFEKNIEYSLTYRNIETNETWFDKSIIDKVLINLLSNAFKFTPNNGKITVLLEIINQQAKISVSDTGKGIAHDEGEKIFERFYQIDDQKTEPINGSGIGLAFSKRLIEVHHGKIYLKSEPDKGSTFMVEFPISRSAYADFELDLLPQKTIQDTISKEESLQKNSMVDLPVMQKKQERILIVEDNTDLRNFLITHFSNYEIVSAGDGKTGFQIALNKVPDIIISDIMMPGLSGLELCKKLKTQFATSHIPIVLLTAKSDISQKIEGIETGADAYIEKPFDIQLLESTIENLLHQRYILRKYYAGKFEESTTTIKANPLEKRFIEKVNKIMAEQMANPDFSVEQLGFELNLSRSQLFRKFKQTYELKPSEYIRNERLKYARNLLLERNYNVNEISELIGFKSASYFITSFKKLYGKTPFEFLSHKN